MPKTNGKKRTSPSVERQLALALVAVLDDLKSMNTDLASEYPARELLKANGYGDLESIPTRVAAITEQINAAVSTGNGKALALLGPALERAKKGLPALATEKKTRAPRTPKAPKEKKPKKGEVSVECSFIDCDWVGTAKIDSACPKCQSAVVAAEGKAK